ncbi:MAG: thiol peroxidase [Bdellovibrionota bacterium]
MGVCTFQGREFQIEGQLPEVGSKAPDFKLVASNLAEVTLKSYAKKRKVINVFPSIDTSVCAKSVQRFNTEAALHQDVAILNVSMDLPFAHKRFCGAEGITRSEALSAFRSQFGCDWGLLIKEGPLEGLLSRAVFVLDKNDDILYIEHVTEIKNEPNYDAALKVLQSTKPGVVAKDE